MPPFPAPLMAPPCMSSSPFSSMTALRRFKRWRRQHPSPPGPFIFPIADGFVPACAPTSSLCRGTRLQTFSRRAISSRYGSAEFASSDRGPPPLPSREPTSGSKVIHPSDLAVERILCQQRAREPLRLSMAKALGETSLVNQPPQHITRHGPWRSGHLDRGRWVEPGVTSERRNTGSGPWIRSRHHEPREC
jgi:hypothetical protein